MTAVKLYIKHLVEGMFDGSKVDTVFGKVSEVRISGTLVDSYKTEDENYIALTVDDGTETIRIKAWRQDTEKLKPFTIGDIVDIVGRVREYNEEIYLSPEIISKISPNKWILRELELMKLYVQSGVTIPLPSQSLQPQTTEQVPFTNTDLPPESIPKKTEYPPKDQGTISAPSPVTPSTASESHTLPDDQHISEHSKPGKASYEEKTTFEDIEEFEILEGDEVVETVLELLKEDMTKEVLIDKSGLDEIDVELALRELLDEGRIIKDGGVYKKKSP
ncbi:MAG: hypothetical protein HXS53_07765 [Theionarchaea archaeon]|nr:hypothetical protein [Theionarchaea archaeon]